MSASVRLSGQIEAEPGRSDLASTAEDQIRDIRAMDPVARDAT
jgi:hypothetical protein